ncbi:cell wall hydrolase [Sphingomonas bacterium]|uniref:cell wall hydrolase n=1 Tax=Sphingomonas bacterium TaxID=1895847 RepID=UPI00157513B5|nr:cell wall hydrolase [Sphingomonas bacterium]
MTAIRRSLILSAAGAFAMLAALFPASVNAATEQTPAFTLPYELASFAPPVADPIQRAQAATAALPDDDADDAKSEAPTAAVDQAALNCMAKVVHHESRGQPRRGQIAVAQTLLNRLKSGNGRFGASICEVANQRGQFFNTTVYHPREDSDDWKTAVDVAREAMAGNAEPAAPGAIFFRAAYAGNNGFFRTRQHVATIGGQVFYR